MSNFYSNYNDIHREIVIADFTNEQIEELLNVLQITIWLYSIGLKRTRADHISNKPMTLSPC